MEKMYVTLLASVFLCQTIQARDIHVSMQGKDTNPGSADMPYRTIGKAAAEAVPGDVITVHEGIYRELVRPQRSGTKDKPIVYQAAKGEKVIVTGSEPAKGWVKVDKQTWKLTIEQHYWQGKNPFDELIYGGWYYGEGKPNHTGMVILDDTPMRETFSLDDVMKPIENHPRWYVETQGNGGKVLMNVGAVYAPGCKEYAPMDAAVEGGDQGIHQGDDRALLGYLRDGSVIHYKDLDFGKGAGTLFVRVATMVRQASIELRTDDDKAELLGKCDVTNTGDWFELKTFAIDMNRQIEGKQSVRLVIRGPKDTGAGTTVLYAQFPEGTDPNDGSVELTVRPQVFYPGHVGVDYITVRGFILQNSATNWAPPSAEQPGLIGPRWSKGWVIEDNEIRNSRCSGISLGRPTFGHTHHYLRMPPKIYPDPEGGQTEEQLRAFFYDASWDQDAAGYHTVRRNRIHHCGQSGIVGCSGASYSVIEDNEIYEICRDETFWGFENAGIKFHMSTDVVIRRNHIYRAYWGLWLDWGNQGALVDANLFHDNLQDDLFIEVCHGPMVISNNILLSGSSMNLKSQGIALVHNLFTHSIWVNSDIRHTYFYKPHSTQAAGKVLNVGGDHRWYNNIFVDGAWLGTWSRETLALPVWYDGNVYAGGAHADKKDLTACVDTITSPDVRLEQREDGWYLLMNTADQWTKGIRRPGVNSALLGRAIIPQQDFEDPSGKPLKIDTDYLNHRRKFSNPYPGPFELPGGGAQEIKVWPMDK